MHGCFLVLVLVLVNAFNSTTCMVLEVSVKFGIDAALYTDRL